MVEKLYPISFQGKMWKEEEVSDVFRIFYTSVLALDENKSVYVSEGERIMPNGEWL